MKKLALFFILLLLPGCTTYIGHKTITADLIAIEGEIFKPYDIIKFHLKEAGENDKYKVVVSYVLQKEILVDTWYIPDYIMQENKKQNKFVAILEYHKSVFSGELEHKVYIDNKKVNN